MNDCYTSSIWNFLNVKQLFYPQSAMMEKKENALWGNIAQALMRLAQCVLMGPADVLMTQIETTAHALVSKIIQI